MKKITSFLAAMLLSTLAFSQQTSPQKMSYQTVIRNGNGDLVSENSVSVRIWILQGSAEGTANYVETHSSMTNVNGLAGLEIGMGSPVFGTFSDIDWSNGPFFIKSEIDPSGGANFSLSGTTELLSVPYALFAQKVANASFETIDDVTSNTHGDPTTDDFVFGSPQLEDDGIEAHDARMFFDKSKFAFRVGRANGSEWNDTNVGISSTAIGWGSIASGNFSTSIGSNTIASGTSCLVLGSYNLASGNSATVMGTNSMASGDHSIAMGYNATASGYQSTAIGSNITAPSRSEFVIGRYNTLYSPQGEDNAINDLDRLFVIGNGLNSTFPSNAMVVLKNGNTGLGTSIPNEVLEIAGDGRAFFGDGEGDDRKGLLIDGIQGETAARLEAYDYSTGNGLDLVINTTIEGGNVGIRTNSPTATLSVNGTANKSGGGSWAVFSDRRLKKDINAYPDGLNTVLAINPVKFKYNGISEADTTHEYVGVIAQELEMVSPYMINTIEINGTEYLEVDNSAMTYMLINAVKELNEIITAQQNEIDELKSVNLEQEETLNANSAIMLELKSIIQMQANK